MIANGGKKILNDIMVTKNNKLIYAKKKLIILF
jgi:hypothetical protein